MAFSIFMPPLPNHIFPPPRMGRGHHCNVTEWLQIPVENALMHTSGGHQFTATDYKIPHLTYKCVAFLNRHRCLITCLHARTRTSPIFKGIKSLVLQVLDGHTEWNGPTTGGISRHIPVRHELRMYRPRVCQFH